MPCQYQKPTGRWKKLWPKRFSGQGPSFFDSVNCQTAADQLIEILHTVF